MGQKQLMFEFLQENASGIGDIIGGLAGIFGGERNRDPFDEIPTLQSFIDAKERARQYSEAAADPDSTFFKNQASLYDELNRKDLVGAINKIMLQNRRSKARGGSGFGVNPERRDESRYRALITGFQDAKIKSRLQARDTLFKLAGQANTQAQGFLDASGTFERFGDANYGMRQNQLQALGDLPGQIGKLFKRGPPIPLQHDVGRGSGGQYLDDTSSNPYGANALLNS